MLLIEDAWAEMGAAATTLDDAYERLVGTCASEGTPLPASTETAYREHLKARRELVAVCRAGRADGLEFGLADLTGDYDCEWLPLP